MIAKSEVADAENATPESSASLQLKTSSLGQEKEDIDNNPLIEGTAQLVLSPEGGRRKKSDTSMRTLLINIQSILVLLRQRVLG